MSETYYRVITSSTDATGLVIGVSDLDGTANRRRLRQDAHDLAGRYILSLCIDGARVIAEGPRGWRVTFDDGTSEYVDIVAR